MRIVSLAPNATDILCSLGARSSLVGVTRWCLDVAPVKNLPQVGDCWKLESLPELLKLKPDLVIGCVPFKTETVGKLLEHPIRFLALNPRTLVDIESDIHLLAGIVGRTIAATSVITKIQKALTVIRKSHNAQKSRLRIYCEAWPNPRISSPGWVAELVRIAGGKPIFSVGKKISDEEVAEANPDVIILAWAATGDRAKPEKTYAVSSWRNLPAIQNRQVFVVRDELLNTPSPILTHGAQQLAKILRACNSAPKGHP